MILNEPGQIREFVPSRSARDDIEYILSVWQSRLNLTHWTIKVDWATPPERPDGADEGDMLWADVVWGNSSDDATIRFHESYLGWDRKQMNETVVHELIHLVNRDLQEGVESAEDVMPTSAFKVFRNRFEHEIEGVIERTAKLFVTLGGEV